MSYTIHADSNVLILTGPALPPDHTLSVLLGNRRIWTFRPSDADTSVSGDSLTVRWPPALARRLSGSAELSLLGEGRPISAPFKVHFDDSDEDFSLVEPGTGIPQVINKWGRIARSFEGRGTALVEDVLDQAENLISLVRTKMDIDLFVTGGTLLGPVRDGRIMANDDDADLAYLSAHHNPSDIALESYALEKMLTAEGYETVRHSAGHLQLNFPGESINDRFYIDIFTYFVVNGWFYGTFHARERASDVQVLPLRNLDVNGRKLPGPAEPAQMLAAIYGAGWSTPDPAFRFVTPPAARRRFHSWLGDLDADRENWEDYHRAEIAASEGPPTPSEWAQRLAAELTPGSKILELGCGLGSDAVCFAEAGHDVYAVDYSRPALHYLASRTAPVEGSLKLRRANLNSLRPAADVARWSSQGGKPLHVYVRLLLDSLTPGGQANTLLLIRHVLQNHGPASLAHIEINPEPADFHDAWNNYRHVDESYLQKQLELQGLHIQDRTVQRKGNNGQPGHIQLSINVRTP